VNQAKKKGTINFLVSLHIARSKCLHGSSLLSHTRMITTWLLVYTQRILLEGHDCWANQATCKKLRLGQKETKSCPSR